jgi:hypothetical protein
VPAAAKATGAAQWVALGVNADCFVPLNELALDAIALLAVPCAAHDALLNARRAA